MEDSLSQLINSLSKSEKIYFQKWASAFAGKRRSNYLELFDALCKRPVPTDTQLRSRFSHNRSSTYFPTLKQYLYDRILESLCQSSREQDWVSKAENLKREAELLIRRKLYNDGLKRLQKARKLTYQLEHYTLLIDILRLENHTLGIFKLHEGIQRKKAINQDIQDLLSYLEQERFYFNLYDELYIYSRTESRVKDPENLEEISRQLAMPELHDEKIPHSLRARHLFYGIHTTYHYLLGDYEKAYLFSGKNLELWLQYPLLREVRFKEFLGLLINHTNRCYHLKKKEEFRQQIETLKQLKAPNQSTQQLIEDRLTLFMLNKHELTGDFTHFSVSQQQLDQTILRHRQSGNYAELRLLLYNAVYLLFIQERFTEALDYSLAFNDTPSRSGAQSYLQRSNRMMGLLIHFELGNYQLLENTLRNHYLQLERSRQLFPFEMLFIKMIRQFIRVSPLYRQLPDYEFYLTAFDGLKSDPAEKKNFEYLNILAWLKAKHLGVPLWEILYGKQELT